MIETNFKHTDIGLIPHDWEVRIIKDFADITTGSQNTQDRIDNGEYPFFVRSSKVERINKYIFDTEGVITAGDGVGTGKIYHYINGKFGLHQRCYLVYNFERVSAKYFYQIFGQHFYDRVQGMTAKSSVDSVRMEMIADMPIPLPPTLAEQEKIANALSKIDQLINDLGALIEKKKAIKQGTMQDLLTAKRRLKGFTGEWVKKNIWEVTIWDKKFNGVEDYKQPEVKKYPYALAKELFAMEDNSGDVFLLSTGGYSGWTTEKKAGQFMCHGEVVTIPWGGVAIVKYTNGKFVTADNRLATSKNTQVLSNKFLYLAMLIKTDVLNTFYRGASIKHPSMEDVLNLEIFLPPTIAEQNAIANVLSSMDTEITNLEQKRDKYIAIKQGMMQNLLTGKIRLI